MLSGCMSVAAVYFQCGFDMLLSLRLPWSRLTSVLPWLPKKGSAYQEGREFCHYLPLRLPLTSQLRIADSSPVRLAANPSGQNLRHGRCLAWPQIRADHQRLGALRCCPRPHQQPQQHAFNPWKHPCPTYEKGSAVIIHPPAKLMIIR